MLVGFCESSAQRATPPIFEPLLAIRHCCSTGTLAFCCLQRWLSQIVSLCGTYWGKERWNSKFHFTDIRGTSTWSCWCTTRLFRAEFELWKGYFPQPIILNGTNGSKVGGPFPDSQSFITWNLYCETNIWHPVRRPPPPDRLPDDQDYQGSFLVFFSHVGFTIKRVFNP